MSFVLARLPFRSWFESCLGFFCTLSAALALSIACTDPITYKENADCAIAHNLSWLVKSMCGKCGKGRDSGNAPKSFTCSPNKPIWTKVNKATATIGVGTFGATFLITRHATKVPPDTNKA